MMMDRIQAAFEKHRNRLKADQCAAELFTYDNDLGVVARWGGVRHGVRANDFIPAGGLSDADIDSLVSRMVDKLVAWRADRAS